MSHDNWYAMPPDVSQWQTFVLSNLARKIPEIPQYIAGIDFSKMDPVLGNADGLVYLLGGMAAIPITVRQNRMAPLDVMVSKNEDFYPVSEIFLQKIYADNVIGEPSNDPMYGEDSMQDGPGQRIEFYNTVQPQSTAAKIASEAPYDVKMHLRGVIEKSAKLLSFFHDAMPDMLTVLYTAEPDVVKEASTVEAVEEPDIMFISKRNDAYYINGKEVTTKVAAECMEKAGLTSEQRLKLVNESSFCLDKREKVASIVIEQNVPVAKEEYSSCIAEVVGLDGTIYKGLLIDSYEFKPSAVQNVNERLSNGSGKTYVFICNDGYAVQPDVYTISRVPIDLQHVIEVSTPAAPEVGMFGTIMSPSNVSAPFGVCAVERFGKSVKISKVSTYMLGDSEMYLNDTDRFYEVKDNRLDLVTNPRDAMLTVEGENVTVGLDGEGKLVFASCAYDQDNGIYALMDTYDISYPAARAVAETTQQTGRTLFKVAKADKKEARKAAPQKQQDQNSVGAPQQAPAPVTQEELDDVASINDPSLMDAYITGKLTDINTAGREQIMQASDSVMRAIKTLGKILFLVRVGKIDYVKEDDAQLALNKLSDVAKSLGVASVQVQ